MSFALEHTPQLFTKYNLFVVRFTATPSRRRRWAVLAVVAAILVSILLVAVNRTRSANGGSASPIHSLAVLPLQNLSADPAQEYFSDGMTDALITELARL